LEVKLAPLPRKLVACIYEVDSEDFVEFSPVFGEVRQEPFNEDLEKQRRLGDCRRRPREMPIIRF